MEEAQENTKMFKSIENEKKVDKEAKDIFKEEGKCQVLNVRMEKTSFSALNVEIENCVKNVYENGKNI